MVGYDSIIPPGREGKVTQEIKLSASKGGVVRKYVTVMSNAKNKPQLKLSLQCTIREELGIEPRYISLKPDDNGALKQTLTLTTQKADLQVSGVTFNEHEKKGAQTTNWQKSLPIHFKYELTKSDKPLQDGYLEYKLDVSLATPLEKTTYGEFTITTNHPKKPEATLTGVILEKSK